MIRQLAHLNFVTNDLSKIIDFYVNKLGLQVKFTLDNKAGQPFGYYFECGNSTFLEFFDQALAAEVWGGNVEELTIGTRYKHFCLEVTGLDEFCKELKSKGVDVSEISIINLIHNLSSASNLTFGSISQMVATWKVTISCLTWRGMLSLRPI